MSGFGVHLIVQADGARSFVGKSRWATTYDHIEPDNAQLLCDTLMRYREEGKVPILCASDEAISMIDRHADRLSPYFYFFSVGGKQNGINYWMQKSRMNEAAVRAGFRVPKHWRIDPSAPDVSSVCYPCLVKPERSCDGSKHDFNICQTEAELCHALDNLRATGHKEVLVLEYVRADYEIIYLGARLPHSGRNVVPGTLRKLVTCKDLWNLGMTAYAEIRPESSARQQECIDRFFDQIPYEGLYSIECMVRGDEVFFLEINFRSDATTYIPIAGGVNLPLWWVFDVTGRDTSKFAHRVTRPVRGLMEFPYLKYRRTWNVFRVVWEWLRADVYSIWWRRDPKPFFYKFIYAFKH